LAGARGGQAAVVEALFRAYFTEGQDISDRQTLLSVVAGAGLDRHRAEAELNGEDGLAAIRAEEAEARRLGVQGVPFFIVNGELALSGAQEPKAFLEVFDRVSGIPQAGDGGGVCTVGGGEPSC
jgi:predicted DsbA family dithiol-disulfide isomerase